MDIDALKEFSLNKGNADLSDELDAFYVYHTSLVEMKDDFKRKLIDGYQKDKPWRKVFKQLKELERHGDNVTIILFLREQVF